MKIDITLVKKDQKSILRQLVELYEYDFTEFNDEDLNPYGFYDYTYFDYYWTETNRNAFFIIVNDNSGK